MRNAALLAIPVLFLSSHTSTSSGQSVPRPQAGAVKLNSTDHSRYVWIPPGSFDMGCSPSDHACFQFEKPRHRVALSRGFWIGRTEVTVSSYRRFIDATGHRAPPQPRYAQRPEFPVVNVF